MPSSPAIKAMLGNAGHAIVGSKCKATTKTGAPCGKFANKSSDYCSSHQAAVSGAAEVSAVEEDVSMEESISNFSMSQLLAQISSMIKGEMAPVIAKLDVVAELVSKVATLEQETAFLKGKLGTAEEMYNTQKLRITALEETCRGMSVKMETMQQQQQQQQAKAKAVEPQLTAMQATVEELKARPASYAAAAGGQGGWTTVPSRSAASGGSPEHLQFVLSGIEVSDVLRGGALGEVLESNIKERIGVSVRIANARVLPLGKASPADNRRRIWFQVSTPLHAMDIRYSRTKLAGSGVVIHDHLTSAELAVFKALQPAWREAKQAGKKVVWRRAVLLVDGSEVKAPVAV